MSNKAEPNASAERRLALGLAVRHWVNFEGGTEVEREIATARSYATFLDGGGNDAAAVALRVEMLMLAAAAQSDPSGNVARAEQLLRYVETGCSP
ncbi:hypothetical protein [Reyranella sp.]|uniref:hypothetical protein n=1 Tax=Reyranella sp. TaxID=1929291 RepID=UPI003C7A1D5F